MWFGIIKGHTLFDTENSQSTTFAKIYNSATNVANKLNAASNDATSGAVVIPVNAPYSGYTTNDTAAIAATLADGTVGQEIWIKLETKDTNNMVVTPANFNNGSTLTFDATGEVAHLMFVGSGWEVLYTTATVA